jgi:hypothetical protein
VCGVLMCEFRYYSLYWKVEAIKKPLMRWTVKLDALGPVPFAFSTPNRVVFERIKCYYTFNSSITVHHQINGSISYQNHLQQAGKTMMTRVISLYHSMWPLLQFQLGIYPILYGLSDTPTSTSKFRSKKKTSSSKKTPKKIYVL